MRLDSAGPVFVATGEKGPHFHRNHRDQGTPFPLSKIVGGGVMPVSVSTAPYPAGSFFAHAASETDALVAASHWPLVQGKVVSAGVSVVEMTVPNATLDALSVQGLVRIGSVPGVPGFPMQTVFLPGAFEELNKVAAFRVVAPTS